MMVKIQRAKRYLTTICVGGGAMTNTITGIFVIDAGGRLPNPVFVKKSGPLACSHEQAVVPIRRGNLIIEVTGPKPAQATNPDLRWTVQRVISIHGEEAEVELAKFDLAQVPASVWEGLSLYHNRDGHYFTGQEFRAMPDRVVTLDYEWRSLIIRAPKQAEFLWRFSLDDSRPREKKEEPFAFHSVAADQTPEEVAKAPRSHLYSLVSSSWIDESWIEEIEPQIIAFAKEVCG